MDTEKPLARASRRLAHPGTADLVERPEMRLVAEVVATHWLTKMCPDRFRLQVVISALSLETRPRAVGSLVRALGVTLRIQGGVAWVHMTGRTLIRIATRYWGTGGRIWNREWELLPIEVREKGAMMVGEGPSQFEIHVAREVLTQWAASGQAARFPLNDVTSALQILHAGLSHQRVGRAVRDLGVRLATQGGIVWVEVDSTTHERLSARYGAVVSDECSGAVDRQHPDSVEPYKRGLVRYVYYCPECSQKIRLLSNNVPGETPSPATGTIFCRNYTAVLRGPANLVREKK